MSYSLAINLKKDIHSANYFWKLAAKDIPKKVCQVVFGIAFGTLQSADLFCCATHIGTRSQRIFDFFSLTKVSQPVPKDLNIFIFVYLSSRKLRKS